MGTPVQPADLPALKSGLLAGVHGLSGCRIEHHAAEVVGELLTLEARFTFYDGVAARKRWVRLLYQGRTQGPSDRPGRQRGIIRVLGANVLRGDAHRPLRRPDLSPDLESQLLEQRAGVGNPPGQRGRIAATQRERRFGNRFELFEPILRHALGQPVEDHARGRH